MALDFAWHPWRHLRVRYPDVQVSCRHRLPDDVMGLQQGRRIWLCRTLTQAERRCTLTHELVHRERGPVPPDPAAAVAQRGQVETSLIGGISDDLLAEYRSQLEKRFGVSIDRAALASASATP